MRASMFRFLAWIQPGRWPRSKKPFIIFKRALIRSSESGRCRGLRSRVTRRNSTASGLKNGSRGSREKENYNLATRLRQGLYFINIWCCGEVETRSSVPLQKLARLPRGKGKGWQKLI